MLGVNDECAHGGVSVLCSGVAVEAAMLTARAVASPVHVVVSDGDQVAGLELGRVADGGVYVDLGPGDE